MTEPDIYSPEFLYDGHDLRGLLFAAVKGGMNKPARDAFGLLAAQFVRGRLEQSGLRLDAVLDASATAAVTALRHDGCAVVPDIFNAEQIAGIRAYLADKPVSYGAQAYGGAGARTAGRIEDVPKDVVLAHYGEADVCRCPVVYRAVNDARLINLVSTYLGAAATISSVAAWWSFPAAVPAEQQQQFHYDRGDFRSCNLFVYLTDVTAGTGPHAFVKHTHETGILDQWIAHRFKGDGAGAAAFRAWMEKFFRPDHEVEQAFGAQGITVFTGPKGTSFLEDTRGVHKGTHPATGARLAFEIVFTVLPKYNEQHGPVARKDLGFMEAGAVDPLVRYATRLIYS